MKKKQPNYNLRSKKRIIQKMFFKRIRNRQGFIGLCGPTPLGYLRLIHTENFRNVILFDNNRDNFSNNAKLITKFKSDKKTSIKLYVADINNFLYHKHFYDLDYCCSISKIREYLSKIMKINEFTMTLSLRPYSEEITITELQTFGRPFIYRTYKDGLKANPMIMLYFPPLNK